MTKKAAWNPSSNPRTSPAWKRLRVPPYLGLSEGVVVLGGVVVAAVELGATVVCCGAVVVVGVEPHEVARRAREAKIPEIKSTRFRFKGTSLFR